MEQYYSPEELKALGLREYGEDILISRKCSIYGAGNISLGSHVRIDDFCLLSGKISLGSYVHIAAGAMLFGGRAGISFGDYSTISSRGAVYALGDDYSGKSMTNPTVPEEYTAVVEKPVEIGAHCIIGTGSTLLPGVTLGEGCSVGAMSLINKSLPAWGIYAGIPARLLRPRSRKLLELSRELESKY